MSSISFSLTEKVIIDPILTLRAPLPPPEPGQTAAWTAVVWQVAQSEVTARVIAIFTSVFAAADTFIHLLTGAYKGICLLIRNIYYLNLPIYGASEVCAHFQQAAWFSGLALIGSIAGAVWPGVFKYCRYSPPSPSDDFPDAPNHVRQLAEAVQKNQETAPFDQLKQFWKYSLLEDKHWFVQIFSHDGSPTFRTVRTSLANTIYQPIQHLRNRQVKWLSAQDVDHRTNTIWDRATVHNKAFFYHATSERSLESILKSKKVEVRHEQAFRGAFVSTKPETSFGRCILAFKRNIERLSPLEHGFHMGQSTYWAGFSRDIPVTKSTLAYIILDKGSYQDCQNLEVHCQKWTGRQIKVISLLDAQAHLESIQNLDMGIPSEWPSEYGGRKGEKILNILQARAAIAAQPIQQRVAMASHACWQRLCQAILNILQIHTPITVQQGQLLQQRAAVNPHVHWQRIQQPMIMAAAY